MSDNYKKITIEKFLFKADDPNIWNHVYLLPEPKQILYRYNSTVFTEIFLDIPKNATNALIRFAYRTKCKILYPEEGSIIVPVINRNILCKVLNKKDMLSIVLYGYTIMKRTK